LKQDEEKYIPLLEWGARRYGSLASEYTLRQWAKSGEIYPPPQKVGNRWAVLPTAQRIVDGRLPLVSRL
jgi:hypothetical protein